MSFIVTELETEVALNENNASKKSFWFRKDFKDIEKQNNCYTLSRYIGKSNLKLVFFLSTYTKTIVCYKMYYEPTRTFSVYTLNWKTITMYL